MSETASKLEPAKLRRMGAPTKRIPAFGPRQLLKLTQTEVAERMGVPESQVAKIEATDDAIEVRALRSYAEAIGATLEVCLTVNGQRMRVL